MSISRHHAEWLALLDISGPFLALSELMRVFPQGLDAHDPDNARALREGYEQWLEQKADLAHPTAIEAPTIKIPSADER